LRLFIGRLSRAPGGKFAESFEIGEHGRKPKPEALRTIFPFFSQ